MLHGGRFIESRFACMFRPFMCSDGLLRRHGVKACDMAACKALRYPKILYGWPGWGWDGAIPIFNRDIKCVAQRDSSGKDVRLRAGKAMSIDMTDVFAAKVCRTIHAFQDAKGGVQQDADSI